MFVLKDTGEFKLVNSDGEVIKSGTAKFADEKLYSSENSTNELKVDDKVLILGESIGGIRYEGKEGVVVQVLPYNHYQVYVKDVILTYWGIKLKLIK